MKRIFMFGLGEIRKFDPIAAYQIGGRILKPTSKSNLIVRSQHDYYFMPTTQPQILI